MLIDGKQIAAEILQDLKIRVENLKKREVFPKLAVVLMGDEESSAIYVRQKELKAKEIGATLEIFKFDETVTNNEVETLVKKLDADLKIHGIILQRPAPKQIEIEKLEQLISSTKEVDGFGTNPIYEVPVAQAVLLLLKKTCEKKDFLDWLGSKKIVVLGKGQTAGGPIINLLRKKGLSPTVIDSKTANKDSLLQNADIIISAVGKQNIINSSSIKKGVILIGVGMHMEKGKLCGDYREKEISDIASFYTPTPGGVGPVNVSMLLKNLIEAAEKSS